jgi:hypothetical protein
MNFAGIQHLNAFISIIGVAELGNTPFADNLFRLSKKFAESN